MSEGENMDGANILAPVADTLFEYLREVIYNPTGATLDVEQLPEEFKNFGKGLLFFCGLVNEMTTLAKEMANGNLKCNLPSPSNEIAAPLKMLHASLRHLTWQTQQVANGDYQQHVDFMGDFSDAFNNMIKQLEQRRKINLDEVSRLEMYMDLLLANSPDPILLFDMHGKLAYAGKAFLERCDITDADSALGLSVRELFLPVATEEFTTILNHLFDSALIYKAASQTEQDVDLGRKGYTRNYRIQITPMLDADGNNGGVMILFIDMTESVRARREAEQARSLAERSDRAKSDFLARMSHELRTPMNAIIGMSAILEATNDPDRSKYCIERINEASRHMIGVINDILDMSNIEADAFTLSPGRFDLRRMVDRVSSAMMFPAREREQRLTVAIDDRLPYMVKTDEKRLSQVLNNLLTNAVKFTQNGGEISLSMDLISETGGRCDIRAVVKDNGIGISQEQQRMLFKPFEQVDGGFSRKYGGTGLGLVISKRIIEMMGGQIWVDSVAGEGSSFTIQFSVERIRDDAQDLGQGSDINVIDGIFTGRKALLTDDVDINREILIAILEDTGIQIDQAFDGIEALERFAVAPDGYDVIFMDIHMPNMDGYEATRRIRKSGLPGADTVPIIAMTANVFQEDIDNCLAAGMNDHLGKPLDAGEVIAALREYLL